MPAPEPLKEPGDGSLLAWFAANANTVRAAWRALNRLRRMGVRFTVAVSKPVADITLLDSQENTLLALPLVFNATLQNVSTYSATANGSYSQAQVQALMDQVTALTSAHNALLAQLRNTGQNPS